jgi:glutamate dehydrogenase (NAD(P)+)
MTDAFSAFHKVSKDSHMPLRTAAYMKALQRVATAQINRGFD